MNRQYNKRQIINNVLLRWIYILIMSLASMGVYGQQQTYPVQVYTQLTPPYTPHIPAYYTGTQAKLKVMLINTDMQQPLVKVYLRMKILSSSLSLVTPAEVYTPQMELQAGVPISLSLNDLEPYFKKENLRVSGGQSEFYRTQMLPDNFYRFHFEVYEAGTNRLVSNSKIGFAQAMIASGEPPILNLPQKGSVIKESNIPSIMFSWTPKHMNSVAAAYGTEYDVSLVEIYDKQIAPEAAFDYSRVLYTETTKSTSFIHTVAQPLLIPGMRYAWRVQAKAREGIDEISVFKNNGCSTVSWFDYTADCKTVQYCGAIYENGHVDISWQDVGAMEYTVEYRKKGTNRWYTGTINKPLLSQLYSLQAGKDYEYRIGSRCVVGDTFQYNTPQAFHIPDRQENGPNCGLMPNINLTNQIPTRELQSLMPVLVGDFPVFITSVSGSGKFTGEGYVGIPYLQGAQIAVTFKDIVVNTDNRLIAGYIETKYDTKNNNMLFDADQYLTGGKGVGDIRNGEEQAAFKVDYTINPDIKALPIKADGTKDEIKEGTDYTIAKGENGKYMFIITDSEGKEHKVEADSMPATIEDKDGNTYEVNDKGEVKPVSKNSDVKLDSSTRDTQSKLASLSFKATQNTKYALDEYRDVYDKVTEYKDQYKAEGTAITASAKFMLPGASDEVAVYIKENNKNKLIPEKVRFVTAKGKEYLSKYDNAHKQWLVTVVAGDVNDGQELYAVQEIGKDKYETLGKLNIFTYEPINRSVTLVPVNGKMNNLDKQALQDGLNEIYGKVGIHWTVNVLNKPFNYTPKNGTTFNVTGSGLLSMFTDDMTAINEAFKQSGEYQEDGLYLFVIGNKASESGTEGDMPLGSQFGYLFPDATLRTIAHEVGHGAFSLEHPFDRPGRNSFVKGTLTDNLMDYPPKDIDKWTELVKIQWDATRAPGHVIGMFQTDKSGMWTAMSLDYLQPYLKNDTYTFITPAGNYIILPAQKLKNVIFSTLDRTFLVGIDKQTDNQPPIGSLIGFITSDNKQYSAIYEGNAFKGYYTKETEKYVVLKNENASKSPDRGIAVFLGIENNEIVNYTGLFKSSNPQANVTSDGLGSGVLLNNSFIINIPKSDRNKIDFYSYLNQVGENINKIPNPEYKLENGESIVNLLSLKDTDGKDYTVESLLKGLINDKCSIEEYLYYFSLINQSKQFQQENASMELDKLLDCISRITIQDIITSYQLIYEKKQIEGSDHSINSVRLLGRTGYDILKSRAFNSNKIYNGLNDIYLNVKTNKTNAYYNLLQENIKNGADIDCSFAALDINVRIEVIDHLINGEYFTIENAPIVYHLINTTRDDDVLTLLNNGVRADKYKWLRLIKEHGNWAEINQLYSEINRLVVDHYTSLNIQPTSTTHKTTVFDADGNEKELSYSYPLGFYQRTFIGLKNEYTQYDQYLLSLCSNSYSATQSTITDDGKISFDGCYVWDYQSQIKVPGSITLKTRQPHLSLDPFEPMELVVIGNFGAVNIPPYKMDNGTVITTTSMMGMLIAEEMREYQSDQNLRKIFDGLMIGGAIVAIPYTGGGSLTAIVADISVVAGVSSSIDLVVASQEEDMTSEEYTKNKEVLDAWNTFHTTVMTADAVGGGAALGKASYQAIRAIGSWDNFVSLAKANGKYLKGNTKELWQIVKFRGRSLGKVVTKDELLKYPPFNAGKNLEFADETLRLYNKAATSKKTEDWAELRNFFIKNKLNEYKGVYWPPMNGGYNIADDIPLTKGMKFDRYQEEVLVMLHDRPGLGGSFVSPIGKNPYTFPSRALNGIEADYALYYEIEVLKDLPIKGQMADVMPWHGHAGGGKQMMFKFNSEYESLEDLIRNKFIKITIKKSPNRQYEKYINLVIKGQ